MFQALETINLQWFSLLNATPDSAPLMVTCAKIAAKYPLYAVALFLVLYALMGDKTQRVLVIKTVIGVAVSLTISQMIITLFPHPRPFVMGVGHTFLEHAPTPSFPSHHMIIFTAIAMSFLLAKRLMLGVLLLALAFIVGWSRIYIGVHFPMDIIGGFCLASVVVFSISAFLNRMLETYSHHISLLNR